METADAYYHYGDALLVLQEENPSGNLIGGDGEEADDDEGENDSDEQVPEASGESKLDEPKTEEIDDDLQISWENLDVRLSDHDFQITTFRLEIMT